MGTMIVWLLILMQFFHYYFVDATVDAAVEAVDAVDAADASAADAADAADENAALNTTVLQFIVA